MRYLVNVFTKSEGRESASSFGKATRHMLQILTYLLCNVCGSAVLKAKMRPTVSWGVNCTLYACVTWKTVNKVSDKFTASVFGVEYISCPIFLRHSMSGLHSSTLKKEAVIISETFTDVYKSNIP